MILAINLGHPKVTATINSRIQKDFVKNPQETKFDFVISYSSMEHSGLGRYGDGVNPWGDLIASAKAWCLTKPGGRMLIGISWKFVLLWQKLIFS